jgi:hypothetical protein
MRPPTFSVLGLILRRRPLAAPASSKCMSFAARRTLAALDAPWASRSRGALAARTSQVVLAAMLAGCGGRTGLETLAQQVGGMRSFGGGAPSASGGAPSGGATSASGGVTYTGGIGNSAGTTCVTGSVTFQVQPAPNAVTDWCLGQPGGCFGPVKITSQSIGPLALFTNCSTDCASCQMGACHPTICRGPVELVGLTTIGSWDGTYYTADACGPASTACTAQNCSPPGGAYTLEVCGFVNPKPGDPSGCFGVPDSVPVVCADVAFTLPSESPVVAVMPAQ